MKGSKKAIDDCFGKSFDATFKARLDEANEFYSSVIPLHLMPTRGM